MVEAVAIYVGGRTGPHAMAAQQVIEVAPCDENLPSVVANLVRELRESGRHSTNDSAERVVAPETTPRDLTFVPPDPTTPDAAA